MQEETRSAELTKIYLRHTYTNPYVRNKHSHSEHLALQVDHNKRKSTSIIHMHSLTEHLAQSVGRWGWEKLLFPHLHSPV